MNDDADNPADWPCHHLAPDDGIDAHMWLVATVNSSTWLHQAAAGETPTGGIQWIPTPVTHYPSVKDAANTLNQEIPPYPATTEPTGIAPATEMLSIPAPEHGS